MFRYEMRLLNILHTLPIVCTLHSHRIDWRRAGKFWILDANAHDLENVNTIDSIVLASPLSIFILIALLA